MQTALNFGVVLLNISTKYCRWIGPKVHPSSISYSRWSGTGQSVEEVVKWMGKHAPVFAVNGGNITVLHEPDQFYASLKDNVSKAKERIVLASLYLGTGTKEQQLVDCIHEAVKQSAAANKSLNVEILLEHTRGSRGEQNSRTMLLPLLQNFTDTVKVSLYHSPSLRGLLKHLLPERFNETVALTHLKVYLTDTSLMMSGANLSSDYFTNRQDRYIEIKNCAPLADYFHGLVSTVRSFSFQLQPDNSTILSKTFPFHPTQGFDDGEKFKVEAGKMLLTYLSQQKEKNSLRNIECTAKGDFDTWIVPLVQMFPFGIRQDEFVTSELLKSASDGSVMCLASGYFNLTRKYIDNILKSSAKCEILTAHPTVNGFYEAKGVAGGIPHAYTLLLHDFFKLILKRKQAHRITVYEYVRRHWTFHAKGLWYYLANNPLPNLTLIGSPNFGHRSVYRDLEAQVAIITNNCDLREALHEEQSRLCRNAKSVTSETFALTERKTPFWVYCITRLIKNFL
ncbi:CDP-diacylglycerol--glycerol-3-phosphate 3-phosphatidyltransferase, mitochondrial-like [Montipora capricornis]|uniref:CDP-diacylglycerol--glycerol-3-phosphate 3-phosphatidyltransferase, mitochondrial-like n=1 Tax=Montipora capricornis TaxID=246305 RepID=UPI0035F1CD5D